MRTMAYAPYTKISNNNFIHHSLHALSARSRLRARMCCGDGAACYASTAHAFQLSGRGRDEAFRKQISSVMNAKRQLRLDLDTFN